MLLRPVIPNGSLTLVNRPAYAPTGRVVPPTTFDGTAVDVSQSLRDADMYGFHPVRLSNWDGALALKIMHPEPVAETFEDEMRWYSLMDSFHIGPTFYGAYQFTAQNSSEQYRGLLMEMILGDPLVISELPHDFDPIFSRSREMQERWNDQSRKDRAKIHRVFSECNITTYDLEILLSNTGHLTVIDPGLFRFGLEHDEDYYNHPDFDDGADFYHDDITARHDAGIAALFDSPYDEGTY